METVQTDVILLKMHEQFRKEQHLAKVLNEIFLKSLLNTKYKILQQMYFKCKYKKL